MIKYDKINPDTVHKTLWNGWSVGWLENINAAPSAEYGTKPGAVGGFTFKHAWKTPSSPYPPVAPSLTKLESDGVLALRWFFWNFSHGDSVDLNVAWHSSGLPRVTGIGLTGIGALDPAGKGGASSVHSLYRFSCECSQFGL
jgi:hypothetical protein